MKLNNIIPEFPTEYKQISAIINTKSLLVYNRFKQAIRDGLINGNNIKFSLDFNIIDSENLKAEIVSDRKEFFTILLRQVKIIFVTMRDRCVFEEGNDINDITFSFENEDGLIIITAGKNRLSGSNYNKIQQLCGIIYNQKIIAEYNYYVWENEQAGVAIEDRIPFYQV